MISRGYRGLFVAYAACGALEQADFLDRIWVQTQWLDKNLNEIEIKYD